MYSVNPPSNMTGSFKVTNAYKKARSPRERLAAKMAKTKGFGVKARKQTK